MTGDKTSMPELSLADLQVLMRQVQDATRAALQAEQDRAQARVASIETAVARLDTLLGSEDAPAYDPRGSATATIRAMAKHEPAALGQNAGLALDLILNALAELTVTTRDIAVVVADLKRRADQQY